MPGSVRRTLVLLASAAAVLALPACHRQTEQERRAALCHDLLALRVTVGAIVEPGRNALVGEVRGDLDKMTPTLTRLEGEAPRGERLVLVQEDYLERLEGVGDDDPLSDVDVGGDPSELGAAYDEALRSLACAPLPVSFG